MARHVRDPELAAALATFESMAQAGEGIFSLATTSLYAAFVALPTEVRRTFSVWIGDEVFKTWDGRCPRCDSDVDSAWDSYARDVAIRQYRCSTCGWRDEQRFER